LKAFLLKPFLVVLVCIAFFLGFFWHDVTSKMKDVASTALSSREVADSIPEDVQGIVGYRLVRAAP
jgi:hypothetical protein